MHQRLKWLIAAGLILFWSTLINATTLKLQSFNGQWVSAENGGGQNVFANRSVAEGWETFAVGDLNGGALQSGDVITLQAFNGQYLSAENGGGTNVVANRDIVGGWEQFVIIRESGPGEVHTGDRIFLQAWNGQYWCAEGGGGDVVNANRDSPEGWETFTVVVDGAPNRFPVVSVDWGSARVGVPVDFISVATDQDSNLVVHDIVVDGSGIAFMTYPNGVGYSFISGGYVFSTPGWHSVSAAAQDAAGATNFYYTSVYVEP